MEDANPTTCMGTKRFLYVNVLPSVALHSAEFLWTEIFDTLKIGIDMAGRSGEWILELLQRNPAISTTVKQCLEVVKMEQGITSNSSKVMSEQKLLLENRTLELRAGSSIQTLEI